MNQWFLQYNTGEIYPASAGGRKQQTISVEGDNSLLSYVMHTHTERKIAAFQAARTRRSGSLCEP